MALHDEFEKLSTEEISSFAANAKEEHLQLDFKTIKDSNLNSTDDKKLLAKCISGFANSSGGIVIWGIDARNNDLGIDCAVTSKEILKLDLFCSRLNELSTQACSPSVEGIVHKKFATSPDKGFVASLIPESDSGPHMAKLGENRYYKRNGQSFLQLEHYDLEDMFGRRKRPKIDLSVETRKPSNGLRGQELVIRLLNTGKAVAKHVGFLVEVVGAELMDVPHPFTNVTKLNVGRQMFSYENNVSVFHPNSINTVLGAVVVQTSTNENMRLNLTVYCEHMQAKTQEFSISPILEIDDGQLNLNGSDS